MTVPDRKIVTVEGDNDPRTLHMFGDFVAVVWSMNSRGRSWSRTGPPYVDLVGVRENAGFSTKGVPEDHWRERDPDELHGFDGDFADDLSRNLLRASRYLAEVTNG